MSATSKPPRQIQSDRSYRDEPTPRLDRIYMVEVSADTAKGNATAQGAH